MTITELKHGSASCNDCRRAARYEVTFRRVSISLRLCNRCAVKLVTNLVERIADAPQARISSMRIQPR